MAEGETPKAKSSLKRTIDIARALSKGQSELRAAYEANPATRPMLGGRARLVDQAVRQIWKSCEMPEEVALLAVGAMGAGSYSPTRTWIS